MTSQSLQWLGTGWKHQAAKTSQFCDEAPSESDTTEGVTFFLRLERLRALRVLW